jgi:hypothetical protein
MPVFPGNRQLGGQVSLHRLHIDVHYIVIPADVFPAAKDLQRATHRLARAAGHFRQVVLSRLVDDNRRSLATPARAHDPSQTPGDSLDCRERRDHTHAVFGCPQNQDQPANESILELPILAQRLQRRRRDAEQVAGLRRDQRR